MDYLCSVEYQVGTTIHNGGDELIQFDKADLDKLMGPPMEEAKRKLEEARGKKKE